MNTKLSTTALERVDLATYASLPKKPVHVVLDNVRSAQNVGSFFRTMDAFRCAKLWLCGITPTPPHREINKTALGAHHSVSWEYVHDVMEAIHLLKKQVSEIWAVEQTSKSLNLEHLPKDSNIHRAFIFGNEVHGVNQQAINHCTGSVEIEQFGTKHSLNVAVCAGIVLWHTTIDEVKFP